MHNAIETERNPAHVFIKLAVISSLGSMQNRILEIGVISQVAN